MSRVAVVPAETAAGCRRTGTTVQYSGALSRGESADRIHRLASDAATLSPECQTPCHPTAEPAPNPIAQGFPAAATIKADRERFRQLEGS